MLPSHKNFLKKTLSQPTVRIVTILLLFVGYSVYNFHVHGVKLVNDSPRYLEYAENLKEGFYFDPHNFWYIGYASYILVIKFPGGDAASIVLGQYVLAAIALLAVYFTSLNIWRNHASAFFSCLSLIIFIDFGQWMSYVLAESIYASFICISLYLLSLLVRRGLNIFRIAIAATAVIITSLVKPTGIALVATLFFILILTVWKNLKSPFLKTAVVTVSLAIILVLGNRMLTTYQVMENYQKGEIIYGITTLPHIPQYHMMAITPPKDIYTPGESIPPLLKIVLFVLHHPVYWLHLFAAKISFLVLHVRPYWSFAHNAYSLAMLLPSYNLFVKTLALSRTNIVGIFSLMYISMHTLIVGITSVDWDGRFLHPMLPVIFLYSGHGLSLLWNRLVIKSAAHL